MTDLEYLVIKFRNAIDKAKEKGEFYKFPLICYFPKGCCDMVSDLLAQFLLDNNIKTYSIHGTFWGDSLEDTQPHTWLVTDNDIIIDITGDQFYLHPAPLNYNEPIYVGRTDYFHDQFDFEDNDICENIGLLAYVNNDKWNEIMISVYETILKYI